MKKSISQNVDSQDSVFYSVIETVAVKLLTEEQFIIHKMLGKPGFWMKPMQM